jgi:undecaprenyl-diphosphatase
MLYAKRFLMRWEVLKRLAIAFMPTAAVGLVLYPIIKTVFLGSMSVVVWSLLAGGMALIAFERWHREREDAVGEVERVSYLQAFVIGLFQSLAVVPGISRAAATIVGGLLMNLTRTTIVEFSFLLAVPTMLAASALDLYKSAGSFAAGDFGPLAVGFLVSFGVAWGVIRWFIRFVQTHTFTGFGWYRITLAGLFILFVI